MYVYLEPLWLHITDRNLAKEGAKFSAVDPLRYTLSAVQLRDNDYPMPAYMRDASETSETVEEVDWVEMPQPEESLSGTSIAEVFAVDCEMCLAGSSKELTRVSVVTYPSGDVLLDELVKPANAITDYLTQYVYHASLFNSGKF